MLHGIGWGAATTAAITLIADIAPIHRRGEAMGIYGMAANVAMALGPTVSYILILSSNYSTLFGVRAVIALVSLLLVLPVSKTMVLHPKTPLFSKEAFFPSAIIFTVSLTYGSIVSFLPLFTEKQGITNPGLFFTVFAITLIIVRVLAGTFTAAFDLGIGTGSILLGVVLQFFGFGTMYLLGGLIVLAGAVLFIAGSKNMREM